MRRETGQPRASLVAHSWGSMPAARAAIAEPDDVDRLVLFAPIARRSTGVAPAGIPAWNDVTTGAQHSRFVADVPKGHPPVLVAFDRWAPAYLASDPEAAKRTPPAVRIPNGPRADNAEAWSGRLAWNRPNSRGLSPSCAAPGIRFAPIRMLPCCWRPRHRRHSATTASSRRAPI